MRSGWQPSHAGRPSLPGSVLTAEPFDRSRPVPAHSGQTVESLSLADRGSAPPERRCVFGQPEPRCVFSRRGVQVIGAVRSLRARDRVGEGSCGRGAVRLSATMDRNRHSPAFRMIPPHLAPGLSPPDEAGLRGHSLELPRGRARHSRFQWYLRAAESPAPDTRAAHRPRQHPGEHRPCPGAHPRLPKPLGP